MQFIVYISGSNMDGLICFHPAAVIKQICKIRIFCDLKPITLLENISLL